jgi:hypothetical protein
MSENGPEMMAPRGQRGIGCLASILGLLAVVAVVVAAVFAGVIVLGIFVAIAVIGLVALGVDRLLLAISPKRRERRAKLQRSFIVWGTGRPPQSGPIIDTTARLEPPGRQPGRQDSPE